MRLFYSQVHAKHDPVQWLEHGKIEGYPERPERVYVIMDAILAAKLGKFEEPLEDPDLSLAKMHSRNKINFLRDNAGQRLVVREDRPDIVLESDEALSLSHGSYEAARAAASCALSGAYTLVEGKEGLVYALCRPPGHHATRERAGGYCLFNNAALAAKYLQEKGRSRPVVLDIDIHHGNGTQEIIYDEPNILFASLNGENTYPHNTGKIKDGKQDPNLATPGILNVSIKPTMSNFDYLRELDNALDWLKSMGADSIVVSAGFDTSLHEIKDLFEYDPGFEDWKKFGLTQESYHEIGKRIRKAGLPVIVVQEGGYNLEHVGRDVATFLQGLNYI